MCIVDFWDESSHFEILPSLDPTCGTPVVGMLLLLDVYIVDGVYNRWWIPFHENPVSVVASFVLYMKNLAFDLDENPASVMS